VEPANAVDPVLVLASSSPRRARILRSIGVPFEVRVSGVDELAQPGEAAIAIAQRLARAKAEAVADPLGLPVLGADTLVVCAGRVLGKPESKAEAVEMLGLLAGRTHEVVTALCLLAGGRAHAGVARTEVEFAGMTPHEIDWYVSTGEPMDKAGGYHVNGAGSLFLKRVVGSPSNVAGLPVRLFFDLSRAAGLKLGPPRSG
jgi:septum formation protein